jgi:cytochrome c biogenesis protein CcmG, thiol:disulfide interchange protein DsbE
MTGHMRMRAVLTAAAIAVLMVVALVINRTTTKHAAASPLRASLIAKAQLPDCPATTGAGAVANGLPSLTLPCLANGPNVDLAKLRGPLVVNIWAGTCTECRVEAPQYQAFAAAARGKVAVLGVVDGTYPGESWDDALDASRGLHLGFPSVWDAHGTLVQEVRSIGIPVSLFVAADGKVTGRRLGNVRPGELQKLVKQYLGVDVTVP